MSPVLLRNLRSRYMEGVDEKCLAKENYVRQFQYHVARARQLKPGSIFSNSQVFTFFSFAS